MAAGDGRRNAPQGRLRFGGEEAAYPRQGVYHDDRDNLLYLTFGLSDHFSTTRSLDNTRYDNIINAEKLE